MSTKKSVSKPVSSKSTKTVSKPATAPKVVCTVESSEASEVGRHFEVFDTKLDAKEYFGRFSAKSPKAAASKAMSSILKRRKDAGISAKGKIHFSIRETTRGSNKKVRFYTGERVKSDNPYERKDADGNVLYSFEFVNKIYVDKEATQAHKA
jgi:hypothetical protein